MGHVVVSADDRPFDIAQLRLNSREYRYRNILEGATGTIAEILQSKTNNDDDKSSFLRVLYLLNQTGHVQVQQSR